MRPLRVYLFHPAVYAWLDAMVRRSAQLHSVVESVLTPSE
jgi:hypothetical protein